MRNSKIPFNSSKTGLIFKRFTSNSEKVSFGNFKDIPDKGRKIVGWWLMGFSGMVVGAIVLGGVTRSVLKWEVTLSPLRIDMYSILD